MSASDARAFVDGLREVQELLANLQDLKLQSMLVSARPLLLTPERGIARVCVLAPSLEMAWRYCCPAAGSILGTPAVLERTGDRWELRWRDCSNGNENISDSKMDPIAAWEAQERGNLGRMNLMLEPPLGSSASGGWTSSFATFETLWEAGHVESLRVRFQAMQELVVELERVGDSKLHFLSATMQTLQSSSIAEIHAYASQMPTFQSLRNSTLFSEDGELNKKYARKSTVAACVLVASIVLLMQYARNVRIKNKHIPLASDAELLPVPIRTSCTEILLAIPTALFDCATCWCWRKAYGGSHVFSPIRRVLHPKLQEDYPDGAPPSRTGQQGKWARSQYFWVLTDLHTSRVRWPLVAALHQGLLLQRMHGVWNYFNDQYFKKQTILQDYIPFQMDPTVFATAVIYTLFLLFCTGLATMNYVVLVGNSTMHSRSWLGFGLAWVVVETFAVDFLFPKWMGPQYGGSMAEFSRFFDVGINVIVFAALIRLMIEQHRGVGGHFSEVEARSREYVHDRLEHAAKGVCECKLCGHVMNDNLKVRAAHWEERHLSVGTCHNWTEPLLQDDELLFVPKSSGHIREVVRDVFHLPQHATSPSESRITIARRGSHMRSLLADPSLDLMRVEADMTAGEAVGKPRRQKLPVFRSTLVLLSLVPPLVWLLPHVVAHSVTMGYYREKVHPWLQPLEAEKAQEWLEKIAGLNSTMANEVMRLTSGCLDLAKNLQNNSDNRSMYEILSDMDPAKSTAVGLLARCVRSCDGAPDTAQTCKAAIVKSAENFLDYPSASVRISNCTELESLLSSPGHRYSSVEVDRFRFQVQQALRPRGPNGTIVAVAFWTLIEPTVFTSVVQALGLLSGNAEGIVPAILAQFLGFIPEALQPVFEKSALQITNWSMQTLNGTGAELQHLKWFVLPLLSWGVFCSDLFATTFVLCLLYCILESYNTKFEQMALRNTSEAKSMNSKRGLFEATLFPGYVFSTCVLAYYTAYVLIMLVFILVGLLSVDRIREAVLKSIRQGSPPVIIALLVKTFLLRKLLFERVLTDSNGMVKNLRLYSMLFPAFIICNFVIGYWYGVARAVIAAIFGLLRCARVDVLVVPAAVQETLCLDIAYDSFMSVVALAHNEYNPVKRMGLRCLIGEHIYSSWYVTEKTPSDPADPTQRRGRSRAANRWSLALTLARNPMLQLERKHRLITARKSRHDDFWSSVLTRGNSRFSQEQASASSAGQGTEEKITGLRTGLPSADEGIEMMEAAESNTN
eukprot:TRINITY_DN26880_c0_g1_i1.p1 TRINITY_DN26880_c0_g1~~TRINITY_DN26880_c0_g1_i1.p1  ORF type:complete len:1316 (+),score=149.98 TRINITY_DN26880_c0_g1_i1:199-3948(+)